MANKTKGLSHAKWMCRYHIVFVPEYRKRIYMQDIDLTRRYDTFAVLIIKE